MAQVPITAIWLYSHRVPICPPELRSSDMSNHPTWIADATVVCVPEEAPHCHRGHETLLRLIPHLFLISVP
jgi:hypothetical protein